MKCPNCGNDVDNSKITCDKCGFSLYGPKNMSINSVYKEKENIQNITGIDYNEMLKNSTPVNNNNNNSNKSYKTIIDNVMNFIKKNLCKIIIGILFIICVILIFLLINKDEPKCKEKVCPKNSSASESFVSNGMFNCFVPNGYKYFNVDNALVLTNEKLTISIYSLVKAKLEFTTSSALKKAYLDQGFSSVSVQEKVLNSKKLFLIYFSVNGKNYANYYYQYDVENAIYGLIYGNDNSVQLYNGDVEKIISYVKIDNSNYSGSYYPVNVNYESIFSRMN